MIVFADRFAAHQKLWTRTDPGTSVRARRLSAENLSGKHGTRFEFLTSTRLRLKGGNGASEFATNLTLDEQNSSSTTGKTLFTSERSQHHVETQQPKDNIPAVTSAEGPTVHSGAPSTIDNGGVVTAFEVGAGRGLRIPTRILRHSLASPAQLQAMRHGAPALEQATQPSPKQREAGGRGQGRAGAASPPWWWWWWGGKGGLRPSHRRLRL